ncbi:hypothetical protein ACH95_23295 [Bacillus glycinifermentans]|uniref:Uncharacterized protein n=1 Tax=Bacillus glycinifermentans TaxID=1664069 RepID=A0A0J6E2U1_9BACI|nr:hypothetical protein [Bacillus glycinifermentans]ATH91770.1 hypothetical protein COP00_03360 [Bacillus glycinifermentans]KMM51710.1 hypothetical protein ACH95_23295 [Bacillus glycinifermentans]KRT95444.1 hypothetical protein AB447_209595 [Bacillus glycinifermentans]MEC0488109.1 hypothetical protein [Bacillus glycinifermentans]MEC0492963.1 hypothetical protein [Bacillus glycinifermentans]
MNIEEFKERIEMGEEFQFYYLDESYWISQNEEGLYLTRERDSNSQSFKTTDELFEKGTIDNKKIKEIWDEIDI